MVVLLHTREQQCKWLDDLLENDSQKCTVICKVLKGKQKLQTADLDLNIYTTRSIIQSV